MSRIGTYVDLTFIDIDGTKFDVQVITYDGITVNIGPLFFPINATAQQRAKPRVHTLLLANGVYVYNSRGITPTVSLYSLQLPFPVLIVEKQCKPVTLNLYVANNAGEKLQEHNGIRLCAANSNGDAVYAKQI